MCGIHVIFDKQSKLDETPIRRMVQSSKYRGPDESRQVVTGNPNIYFGANRLMITDQSPAGSQPMEKEGDVLVYNGEGYHATELKNNLLDRGVTFTSASDTEILFRHLQSNGTAAISGFQGMYALAFYEAKSQSVVLARDPRGMKPLYYYEDDRYFIASSEIHSILASGLVEKDLEEEAIRSVLTRKYVSPPVTFFKGISAALPGEVITVTPSTTTHRIQKPTRHDVRESTDPVDMVDTLLTASVLRHIPDIPFGLLLSGGMDSTLLLALLDREGMHIPTFSFVSSSGDQQYGTQDYRYARMAASQYRADHHIIESNQADIFQRLDDYIACIDQPIGDSAGIITWMLSEAIGKEMKVAWSGAGADELFGGYNRHVAFKKYLEHQRSLLQLRGMGKLFAQSRLGGEQLSKFFHALDRNPSITFLQFSQLLESHPTPAWEDVVQNRVEYHLQQALAYDLNQYLVNDVLMINDTMGMQAGVEIRSPYLDTQLVAWAHQVPATQKLAHGPKWMLGALLKKLGGAKYVKRKKEGFGLPIRGWINEHTRKEWTFDDPSFILHKFVTQSQIDAMLDKHVSGKKNLGPELWAILVLGKWLKKEFS